MSRKRTKNSAKDESLSCSSAAGGGGIGMDSVGSGMADEEDIDQEGGSSCAAVATASFELGNDDAVGLVD